MAASSSSAPPSGAREPLPEPGSLYWYYLVAISVGFSIEVDLNPDAEELGDHEKWRYLLSSREVHFLSRTRPWHTHAHAHLCSCLEAFRRDGGHESPHSNFDIACNSG